MITKRGGMTTKRGAMITKKGGMLVKWGKGGAAVRIRARLRPPGKEWTIKKTNILWATMATITLWGCAAKGDRTGTEFAPQMYHSVAYEPLTQVKDKKAGQWLSSTGKKDSVGEFYNGNPYHPSEMSMREPVPGTVQHMDLLNYLIPKDSLALAARVLRSPYAEATDKKKAQVSARRPSAISKVLPALPRQNRTRRWQSRTSIQRRDLLYLACRQRSERRTHIPRHHLRQRTHESTWLAAIRRRKMENRALRQNASANTAHHEQYTLMEEKRFHYTASIKKRLLWTVGLGLVLMALGILLGELGSHHHVSAPEHASGAHELGPSLWKRLMTTFWHNAVFFVGIGLCGVVFSTIQYAAQAGWATVFKRVPEAFGHWIYPGFLILLVLFVIGRHDLFHWTHSELYDTQSEHYDPIIAGKKNYLNVPFFLLRMTLFFIVWHFLFHAFRKRSLREELPFEKKRWNQTITLSIIFLVFFALSSSVAAWDWIMSIDTHWFSTMFGWYAFASWWVSALALATYAVATLKQRGYLPQVNESHLHDLGKFVFAFSIFWTYIWFSQFMLIYYANLPEESAYFVDRIQTHYGTTFWTTVGINFFAPFLLLMTRDAKRNILFLQISAAIVFLGHWLDFYLLITPGVLKEHGQVGLIEIGCLLLFLSLFLHIIFKRWARSPFVPPNHPFLKESINHHI